MSTSATHSVLTRHFLRRFLENDLIAPDADRSQLLAVVGAALFSGSLFITVVMSSVKYVMGFHTPGQAAIDSLDDKFFYVGISMVAVALLAVSQWDALVVDARDAAILEPLPVRRGAIRRAKLASIAVFGTAASLVVNVAPTLVFPLLVLIKQHVGIVGAAALMATHAAVTLAAAAFGYLSIVAIREVASAVLGARWFGRVSPWLQGSLVVLLGSALLLVPPAAIRVERNGLGDAARLSPPAWFLGAYETLAGGIIVNSPRGNLTARLVRADAATTAAYRRHERQFEELAGRAVLAFSLIGLIAILAYAFNARRLPTLAPVPVARTHRSAWRRRVAQRLIVRHPATRAGFFLTLAVLWRSNTHRLTMACAGAAGLAMSLVALSALDVDAISRAGRAVPRLLIVQPFLVGALLVGFRHAIRVPAELRANWGIQLAWRGQERRFVAGARRAAVVALVVPAILIPLPLVAAVLGTAPAILHALLGFAGGLVLLEALLFGYEKVPFTCSYVPNENIKALGPIYIVLFQLGSLAFATLESTALNGGATLRLLTVLAIVFAALRVAARTRRPLSQVDFDEAPATTQRLGLHT